MSDDHEEAVRQNQNAANELEKMRDTIETLTKLRQAGIAKGSPALRMPHSGRYGELPQPARPTRAATKFGRNA
jgi:hypothetical protein